MQVATGRFARLLPRTRLRVTLATRSRRRFFRTLQASDGLALQAIVGATHVTHEPLESSRNVDWTRHYRGEASLLVQPANVEEVAEVLRYCHTHALPIVPQGGRTGLVGGGVPTHEREILLSLDRLNAIESLDETTGILQCQAGCILQTVQDHARERQHLVPIDLGAKGSCQVGGNLSTFAGGQYYYRYGSLAANVLGLQVVLANGRILNLNYPRTNLKDNTGYKMHQIFLGAEGTLGVITAVALLCPPYPVSQQAAWLACESFADVVQVLRIAKRLLGESLAALEFMDATTVETLQQASLRIPLVPETTESDNSSRSVYPYYLLVETHGSSARHDEGKLEAFLTTVLEGGLVADGVVAQDESQRAHFWKLRESANPTVGALGYSYKYDLTVPVAEWMDFCEETRIHVRQHLPDAEIEWVDAVWGHIVDGNMHYNFVTPRNEEEDPRIAQVLEPFLFEAVLRRGGSISAEHGLGQAKRQLLPMVHEEAALQTMRELKNLFDPKGILNPHKVLPS